MSNIEIKECSYGCKNEGKFKKRGRDGSIKWCCSKNLQHCPEMKRKQSEKTKNNIEIAKELGTYSEWVRKSIESHRKINQETGLSSYEEGTIKMVKTRTNNNSYKTGCEKGAKTKMETIDSETGKSLAKIYGEKAGKTRKNTIDIETGFTIAQLCSIKGIPKRHTPDESGLSSYDKGQLNAIRCKKYKESSLFYGSSYEFKWLEEIENLMGFEWLLQNVKRGPVIRYLDPIDKKTIRYYPADFIFDHYLIEIKSDWIFHKTEYDKLKNIAKLDKSLELGYDVRLIMNFKEYIWKKDREYVITNF